MIFQRLIMVCKNYKIALLYNNNNFGPKYLMRTILRWQNHLKTVVEIILKNNTISWSQLKKKFLFLIYLFEWLLSILFSTIYYSYLYHFGIVLMSVLFLYQQLTLSKLDLQTFTSEFMSHWVSYILPCATSKLKNKLSYSFFIVRMLCFSLSLASHV